MNTRKKNTFSKQNKGVVFKHREFALHRSGSSSVHRGFCVTLSRRRALVYAHSLLNYGGFCRTGSVMSSNDRKLKKLLSEFLRKFKHARRVS